jgi:hypothetical protein
MFYEGTIKGYETRHSTIDFVEEILLQMIIHSVGGSIANTMVKYLRARVTRVPLSEPLLSGTLPLYLR